MFAVLINGGADPQLNYASHLVHLRELHATLVERGVPADQITVFASDGQDRAPDLVVRDVATEPDAQLLEGTALERFLPVHHVIDTHWPEIEVRPATLAAVSAWVAEDGQRMGPDATLVVYVTDHGLAGDDVADDARIALWRESVDATGLAEVFDGLPADVRIVLSMSQCYSGAFDRIVQQRDNTCGFFASPAERPSYGCFPEGRARYTGHGARWIEALSRHDGLDAAHAEVLLTDRTPDVPLTSSALWLRRRVLAEAQAQEVHAETLVDRLLPATATERADVRALAAAAGVEVPRSLAALRALAVPIPKARARLEQAARAWDGVLDGLRADLVDAFLSGNPKHARSLERLDDGSVEGRALAAALVGSWLRRDVAAWDRVQGLQHRRDTARQAAWRLAVREGWLLRIEAAYQSAVGEVLAGDDTALAALRQCEATAPGVAPGAAEPEGLPAWPPLAQDLLAAERTVLPWLGLQSRPTSAAFRAEAILPDGAVTVQTVFPGSPAAAANIEPGDVLLGPPDAPFSAPWSLIGWTLTSPLDRAVALAIRRGDRTYTARVTFAERPEGAPALATGPAAGQRAPDLVLGVEGREHLLFFWATWCGPCKAALPELLAWSERSDVPIVAITDEPSRLVRRWRRGWAGPFPERAIADPSRDSFQRYGVHGRPVFVHVGADGRIVAHQQGYSLERGLFREARLPGMAGIDAVP